MTAKKTEVLIVGGSLGGVAAALSCARQGVHCIIVEETRWLGGQATAQGVPVDEHPWIEKYGRTQSYADFREKIRAYYRRNYRLTAQANSDRYLNPGACWVSAIGFEPKVGAAVIDEILNQYRSAGLIETIFEYTPISSDMQSNKCRAICFKGKHSQIWIEADYILDATELGDLLPLTGAEHRIGAESQADTGEPLALEEADVMRQQPFTHLIAVDYHPGENHVIEKPKNYEDFRFYLKSCICRKWLVVVWMTYQHY